MGKAGCVSCSAIAALAVEVGALRNCAFTSAKISSPLFFALLFQGSDSHSTAPLLAIAKIEEISSRFTMNTTPLNRRNPASKRPSLNYFIASSLCLSLLGYLGTPARAQQPVAGKAPVVAQAESAPATPAVSQQILGQWQAKDPSGQRLLTFIFGPEGQLFIVLPAEEAPAPAVEMGYAIDAASQPMHLDVKINTAETVLTVFEFTSDGKLRLQLEGTNPGQPRPEALSEGATLFEKVSDATTLPADARLVDVNSENK